MMDEHLIPKRFTGPGLIDLQVNGYAGFDFNGPAESWTPEELHRLREAMEARGVAAALPTFTTDHLPAMLARMEVYARIVEADDTLANFYPKLHLEGPFISKTAGPRGAHPLAACVHPADHPDFAAQVQAASGGRIGILTLAPELPGAMELIAQASQAGIRVAFGHTEAEPGHFADGLAAGASMSTHLGNAAHEMLPRLDNYIQRQLAMDDLHAGFIPDGHHIPFPTLKNFLRAKPAGKSFIVSDAIAGADMPPGRYHLGETEIEVLEDGRTRMPGHAGLAGSALTLDRGVLNVARHCGLPFETAWDMASRIPAKLLGMAEPAMVTAEVGEHGFRRVTARA